MNKHTLAAIILAATTGTTAIGQEAMFTNAATMPIVGSLTFRPQLFYTQYGADPDGTSTRDTYLTLHTDTQIGIARGWSLSILAPVEYQTRNDPAGNKYDTEVESVDLMAKGRFYLSNTGAIDTERAAVIFGTKLDLIEGFNVNPHVGLVYTKVHGQHGVNFDVSYLMTTGGVGDRLSNVEGGTGTADLIRFNSSYVFRFYPEAFTSASTGGYYLTAEINTLFETNGDQEVRWSPGFMYEGREVSFEAMLQLPLWHDLDERPELDWSFGVGLRILF